HRLPDYRDFYEFETPPNSNLKFAGGRTYRAGPWKCRSRLLASRTIWPTISMRGLWPPRPRTRKPCASQIRAIVLWDRPVVRASDRVDQRVASGGLPSRVLATTCAAISS